MLQVLRTGLLALIIAVLAPPARADAPAPTARPSATGPAVDGVALALVAGKSRFVEGRPVDRQLMSVRLYLKNVTKQPRAITVTDAPFYPDLELVDARGRRFTPTFLPPPTPRPGGPSRRRVTLAPGSFYLLGEVNTFSGFQRAKRKGRHYPMLPAGRYRVRARGVTVRGVKGKLQSNPAAIEVGRSDRPVNHLRLGLRARRPVARSGKPTTIEIVFSNTGKRPLSLDLERGRLELDVRGPSLGHRRSDRRPAPRDRRPVIPPRRRLRFKLPFPGTVGERSFRLGKPGWYRLLLSFRCPASDAKQRAWSGEVRSRPLWIAYR